MKISSAGPLKGSTTTGMTPDFTIFTSAMEIDSERENVVRMIGSSTERDLHGDTMALSALTDMAQVEPGLIIWLNHDYELPGSLFGSLQEKPELRLQGGIADLHIVSDVETSNPNAVQTYGYIKKGKRLGCSIGCMILEYEIDEENDDDRSWWPPIIITHVQTLEWSVVGIPANQRSWTETATKGLFERMASQDRGDEALKLAPAVKGLYPRAYEDYLKTLNSEALRKDLERIEARPTPKQRVEWVPNERMFVMNQKGVYKPLRRDEVTDFLAKGIETPRYPGFAKESTEGTVVKSSDVPGLDIEPDDAILVASGIAEIYKGASGKTTWPLADEDTAWDSSAAHKRIMEWAGGDDPDWAKVKSVHFWFDSEKADTWGGYKLPFCDNDSGIKAIPKAVYAVAGAIDGARSPLDIPDDDIAAIKKKVEVYYHKLDKKAPWEDKEDAAEPDKETDVNHLTRSTNPANGMALTSETITVPATNAEEMAVQSVDNQGKIKLKVTEGAWLAPADPTPPAIPADVQLFNVLAERFGVAPLALSPDGQVIKSATHNPEPAISPETIQEVIALALNFGETIKAGNQFNKKNQQTLQSLHNNIVDMCKSQFHPCKEMDEDADGDDDGDGKKQLGLPLDIKSEIEPLAKQVTLLIETLSKHGIDPKAINAMQSQIDAEQRRIKELQATTNQAEERLAKLQNAPLGQPTLLRRGIQDNGDIVSHQDFKALSLTAMNDNERRWSLEEALKATIVVPRTLAGGETMNYRKWPANVGGSVKDGVRPTLTGTQRTWMHPAEMLSYNDGDEAAVPCYDDPGGIEA